LMAETGDRTSTRARGDIGGIVPIARTMDGYL
jgi:hypothetical protein